MMRYHLFLRPLFICSVFLFFLCGCIVQAAVLSIPSLTATPGQWLVTPVTFAQENAQISGIQFDLAWDAGLSLQIAVGRDLAGFRKLVYSAQPGTSSIRVLIVGTDQGLLGDGEVMRLFLATGPNLGSPQIRMTNVGAVSPDGTAVQVRTAPATVSIGSGNGSSSGGIIVQDSVLNAASLLPGPIAPGEIVTLLGAFGIPADSSAAVAATMNGAAMPVLYARGNQINAIVPVSMDSSKPAALAIGFQNQQIAQLTLPTTATSPALFTQNGTGIGLGAILNQDYSYNSPSNPAPAGSIVALYGTGFGPLLPPAVEGQPGVMSATQLPVVATIGGQPADVLYAGAAPQLPGGVVQINLRIPAGIPSLQPAPVAIKVGDVSMPNGITVAVR